MFLGQSVVELHIIKTLCSQGSLFHVFCVLRTLLSIALHSQGTVLQVPQDVFRSLVISGHYIYRVLFSSALCSRAAGLPGLPSLISQKYLKRCLWHLLEISLNQRLLARMLVSAREYFENLASEGAEPGGPEITDSHQLLHTISSISILL